MSYIFPLPPAKTTRSTQSTSHFMLSTTTAISGSSSGICVVRFLSIPHYLPSRRVELACAGIVAPLVAPLPGLAVAISSQMGIKIVNPSSWKRRESNQHAGLRPISLGVLG